MFILKCLRRAATALAFVSTLTPLQVAAQQSAYADLNECTKQEQIKLTAQGAALGALAGLFTAKKDEDRGRNALAGAAVGGAAGFLTAYFTAVNTCFKLNPSWIPENQLVRDPGRSYDQVKSENRYTPNQGVRVAFKSLTAPRTARSGESLNIASVYDVMSPDGAEASIAVDRKLYNIVRGQATELSFPGKTNEQRTVEVGRVSEVVKLQLPNGIEAGTVFKVLVSVSVVGQPPAVMVTTITVQ
jgi:gas vesicle protein